MPQFIVEDHRKLIPRVQVGLTPESPTPHHPRFILLQLPPETPCQPLEAFLSPGKPADINTNALALDPGKFLQPVLEELIPFLPIGFDLHSSLHGQPRSFNLGAKYSAIS